MGIGLHRARGQLVPAFTENSAFTHNLSPQDGILERIDVFYRGDHDTLITAGGQIDGEANIFQSFQVTIPRKGLSPLIYNPLPRDHKFITQHFEGALPLNANPLADLGTHDGMFSIYIALPERLARDPLDFGLDSQDISDSIIIEGNYGANASIGPSATGIRNITDFTVVTRQRRPNRKPFASLSMNQNFLVHDSTARRGPSQVEMGNIEALYGVFLRQHDNSAVSAQRVDGLITRFILEHSQEGILADDLFQFMKRRSAAHFGLPQAEVPAGITFPVFSRGGDIGDMPIMIQGRKLTLIHDSAEAVPTGTVDVVPAASDAVYAIAVGIQLTRAGLARGTNRGPG